MQRTYDFILQNDESINADGTATGDLGAALIRFNLTAKAAPDVNGASNVIQLTVDGADADVQAFCTYYDLPTDIDA